jgi:predicted lipoprotein with Yx(FWY)xxD motif
MKTIVHYKKFYWFTGLMLIGVLAMAACQPAAAPAPAATAVIPPTGATNAPTAMPPAASFSEPTVTSAMDPKLGNILVDSKGMTLYMFTVDKPDQSNCTGDCLTAWPPLLTKGSPMGGLGVDATMLGSVKLADGRMIVTYNHMPLYYWFKDKKPGDTTGQNVGKTWFVVNPQGKPVMEAAPTAMPATPAANAPMMSEASLSIVTDPKLGKILVDGKGMTLYAFEKDGPDKSMCSGGCAKAWPPLLSQGKPVAGMGVNASWLGVAKLADGTWIVTYNHMPLYYFAKDQKPGDTMGQDVGGSWYVVSPDGKTVDS